MKRTCSRSGLAVGALSLALTFAATNAALAAPRPHPTPSAAVAVPVAPALPPNAELLTHGRFKDFIVYKPVGAPTNFVLFLSGDDGWDSSMATLAQRLAEHGAMVAGIDMPKFKDNLNADAAGCVFPDGDLENLSHFVQAYYHNPNYLAPMLVGASSGAAMAYAMLVQAPNGTFANALTMGFCPNFDLAKPLCKGSGLESTPAANGVGVKFLPPKSIDNPWVSMQSGTARSCAAEGREFVARIKGAATAVLPDADVRFVSPEKWLAPFEAAYAKLAAASVSERAAPAPAALGDLPVIELPAQPDSPASDAFAIIMSGDGGWAGLDKDVAAALTARGIPVVGLDSLRYYWTARTPAGLAADTDRMIRYYLKRLGKKRVLLVGYSQGADVLPFAVNRLPQATRASVALTAIMGMSEHALFEFHVTSWISDDNSGPATLPEVEKISGMPVLCIYGEDETDSLCPKLDPKKNIVVKLKGGHHFDGDYSGLAREIITASESKVAP